MDGPGVLTQQDGSKYDGEWKNGKKHGVGTLKEEDGIEIEAIWVNGT